MTDTNTPQWQPLSAIVQIALDINEQFANTREQYDTLLEARDRNVRRVVVAGGFNHDCVAHGSYLYFFKPDCFRVLLSVPDAKSSLGLPVTVDPARLSRVFELP